MTILQILEDIGSDTKRSHKLELIKQHKSDALFMKVVKLALDPYVQFYIRKIPSYAAKGGKTLDWALAELDKLSNREFTGHAGIEHLRSILSSLTDDDAIVIERVIGKDLRCGMADGTINTVVKNYIPTYPCLLARPYDAKSIKNIVYPAFSQLKADGVRANFHVTGDKVVICGRSGRTIDILGYMDEQLINLGKKYIKPMVFDGELVVVDDNGKLLSRKVGNGIINKAIKGTISDEEAKMIRAQLWDAIPIDQFRVGLSVDFYFERYPALATHVDSLKAVGEDATANALAGKTDMFWMIPTKEVSDLAGAQEHFEEMLAAGEEGTILKNKEALWEDTRSKHLVKFKAEKDADLEIIGWNPGTGKFVGMVGSLIGASSDRKVETAISGFSDDLRKEITKDIDSWMGGIITVLYNERISSAGRPGVDSLFLPRFMERRLDKSAANSSKEIK